MKNNMQANIGLGLAALGRPGYINLGHAEDLNSDYGIGTMRRHAHAVLDAAWELGIRYFDVARSYGRAEEFLASWIHDRQIGHEEIQVGSKWGYTYTAAWQVTTPEGVEHEVKRHDLRVLQTQFQTSMNHLSDHLDLYQIHSATQASGVLENREVLERLNGLRESGIKIGLSVSGVNQSTTIDQALAIQFGDKPLFGSVQATWNLLETSATESLKKAHAAGVDVIVKESLANGRLTGRNNAADFAQRRAVLEGVAKELDSTIDAISIAAALNQDWVTTVLSGAATEAHLRSNAKAAEIQWSTDLTKRLDAVHEPPKDYWQQRAELAWN
jgi:aryl-alcohol dehydrogenase-like predicted oxidoreductase